MTGARASEEQHPQMKAALQPFNFAQVLSIADALPMPIALVDQELHYRFCNRAFAEFFGMSRGEILKHRVSELLPPAAFEAREPMLRAALSGERQWFAATYDHPQRGRLALQTEYIPQLARGGESQGVVIIVQDVTEQRVAERALRESEARFRRIADSAPVMMWVTRRDGQRDFVNDAYLEFAGIGREQMNSHDWRGWIHPDDFERVKAESAAGEASLKPFTLSARYRRADGQWRWLESVSRPRFGPDGELLGFIGAAFDITSAKEAETELRRLVEERTEALSASEARFRAIFDAMMEVIVLLRPDGTVVEVNSSRTDWRAGNPHDALGRPLWETATVQAYPAIIPLIRKAIDAAARGQVFSQELVLEREGSPSYYLATTIHPIRSDDGTIRHLLFEAHDISELKGAQAQLRQSQKMEALGQLTGGIAHDFNNLLTVVVGGLDLIAKRETEPKLQRYAKNALEAAERGARLTAQLLAFSRVQRMEVRPTYVAPLIENMRPLLRNVLGPGITKTFELDENLMPILADPTQLELAVLNLAINARDAMPDGGELTFRSEKTTISGDPELEDGDYIKLSIGDSGVGMTPDVIERAFEPFFTTKEVGKGTGLGLSMVYGVARQSGGTARIFSTPGQGTCVELYFRRAPETASVQASERGPSAEKRQPLGASVLVIDDDPDVREFVAATLSDLGYSVSEAADGASGIAAFRQQRPDVVILDFLMPGVSGADVARAVRAQEPDQPILFVSGYSETDAIQQAAPGAPLLPKPFRAEALDDAVRAVLGVSQAQN